MHLPVISTAQIVLYHLDMKKRLCRHFDTAMQTDSEYVVRALIYAVTCVI